MAAIVGMRSLTGRAGMETDMGRQHRTDPELSVEVNFEPRRGGQDALTSAYQRLLPPLSRPIRPVLEAGLREKTGDAAASDGLDGGDRFQPDFFFYLIQVLPNQIVDFEGR